MNISNIVLARIGGTYIPVESADFTQGITLNQDGNSFSIFPTVNYVSNKQPVATLTTKAVDTALAKVGFGNFDLDSTSTFDMWIVNKTTAATDANFRRYWDTTGAIKISFTSGVVVLDSISVSGNDAATVSYRILAAEDSGSVGVTISENQTVPDASGLCQDYVFVTGPFISGDTSSTISLTGWTYNANYSEEYVYTNGLPVPTLVSPTEIAPSFSIESNDKDGFVDLLASNEVIGCVDNWVLYLRKTDPCASRVANNVSEHISVTINKATLMNSNVTGGYRQNAAYSYELRPLDDCTDFPMLALDLSATIPE